MKILKLIVSALVLLLLFGVYQVFLPTLSLAYLDGFIFCAVFIIALIELILMWTLNEQNNDVGEVMGIIMRLGIIIAVIIFLVGKVLGSGIFNHSTMKEQIGEIEERSFLNDIVEIDNSQIPTVDIELAAKLADKKLGEDIGLGSQMEVGEFRNKQSINGKLVYVAPLEHTGFFKWLSNSDGTVGYVIVSATNSNDVKLVQKDAKGEDFKLKYVESAFFSSDLKRHIRNQGYRTTGLEGYHLELDDNGYPYYVVTTFKNKTLWGSPEATGVVICDAQTGKCQWYSVDDTPEWVDIIQPERFIQNQLENYGEYANGWPNLSNKNKLSVTEHMTTVYNLNLNTF